jgi:hypothetical protein
VHRAQRDGALRAALLSPPVYLSACLCLTRSVRTCSSLSSSGSLAPLMAATAAEHTQSPYSARVEPPSVSSTAAAKYLRAVRRFSAPPSVYSVCCEGATHDSSAARPRPSDS